MLTFAEEILLLMLDDKTGEIRPLPPNSIRLTLTGALLMELALENRIDTDLDSLNVVDTEPTGDPLLDDALLFLQRKNTVQNTTYWLNELTLHQEDLQERLLRQLVNKGVLKIENRKILWMFNVRRYPMMDNQEVKEVRNRLRGLIMSDEIPDSREVVLISLVYACNLLEYMFSPQELARWKYRIESLAKLDLIGQQVGRSITEITQALATSMPVC